MDPRIQYTRTADGVSIASWTLGGGKPLVYLAGGPWNHIELWQVPECQRWYDRLAQQRMLVRYDMRGTGLSERKVSDYSLDARVLDVESVVDCLGLEDFALLGAADGGPVAVTYAVRHPERVSRLVLWCTWARSADIKSPRIRAWLSLLDQDWELMTETCAHIVLGWSAGELGRQAAQHLRESVTPEALRAAFMESGEFDITALLARVNVPTLVVTRREIPWIPADAARTLASGIPGARLTVLEGQWTAPYLGDTEAAAVAIEEFLHEDVSVPVPGGRVDAAGATGTGARGTLLPAQPQAYPNALTGREVEVLRLVAGGRTNKEIAEELVLSVRTVERHVANIYGKIRARGRADATAYALTRGLI